METTNNSRPMLIDGLSCVCGYNKIYYYRINVDGVSDVNQLACPNCGIIMRSPNTDENGEWLKKHWKQIHCLEERGLKEMPDKKYTCDEIAEKTADGCEWCQPNSDGEYTMSGFANPQNPRQRATVSFYGGMFVVELDLDNAAAPSRLSGEIKFCPMCGREICAAAKNKTHNRK